MLEFFHNNEWREVGSLEFTGLVKSENDRAAHTLEFSIDATAAAPYRYAVGDLVALRRDGNMEFVGNIRSRSKANNTHRFTAVNVWWFFENIVFEVDWDFVATAYTASHVTLCRDGDGNEHPVGWQIRKAIERAAAQSAPVTFNQPDLDLLNLIPPIDEAYDLTCAEVVNKMLRWYPNTAICFDYPANPAGTVVVRFLRDDTAETVTLSLAEMQSFKIDESDELIKGVKIVYEVTSAIINGETTEIIEDRAGAQSGPGVMVLTKDVHDGSYVTTTVTPAVPGYTITETTELVVASIPTPYWYNDWEWAYARDGRSTLGKEWCGSYETGGTPVPISNPSLSTYIVSGYADGFGISRTSQSFYAVYKMINTGGVCSIGYTYVEVSFSLWLTASPSGTYYKYTEVPEVPEQVDYDLTEGVPPPPGIAGQFLLAQNNQRFVGSGGIMDLRVQLVGPGRQRINILDGDTEWLSMLAPIKTLSRDYMTEFVNLTFGRSRHLSPSDFIEFQMIGRGIRRPNRDR
jgi:hypothetical protein